MVKDVFSVGEKKKDEGIHAAHRSRMQQRVEREGLTSLAAHEVLEYLLFFSIPRKDTNALAHRLIQHFGGFCEVLDATEEQLMEVDGIGPASARLIHSFREVERCYEIQRLKEQHICLNTSKICSEYVRPLFSDTHKEQFFMIAMNDSLEPLKNICIGVGSPNAVKLDASYVIRSAVNSHCTCVLLAHNHPAGLPVASSEDVKSTQAIIRLLKSVSVNVVDHIIIAQGKQYFSFADHGFIERFASLEREPAFSVFSHAKELEQSEDEVLKEPD